MTDLTAHSDITRAIRDMDESLTIRPVTTAPFTVTRKDVTDIMASCGVGEEEAIERLSAHVVEMLEGKG